MRQIFMIAAIAGISLVGCTTPQSAFKPVSAYPPDPWVKGYANPDDCLGGEKLAAIDFDLPKYPSGAYNSGRQGWVIIRLDVDATGMTTNIDVERSVPDGLFENATRKAVKAWRFEPPVDGALSNCRVLIRFRAGEVTLGA